MLGLTRTCVHGNPHALVLSVHVLSRSEGLRCEREVIHSLDVRTGIDIDGGRRVDGYCETPGKRERDFG
jgi:hypothetical protein